MLIPSIDLMGGKIVQLIQGERKALEFEDFGFWLDRFKAYPLVQLIDLDAAMGKGNNRALIREFARRLPSQVGGGIRSVEDAREILGTGAQRAILGSSLIRNGLADKLFAQEISRALGQDKLVFAIDSKQGVVAIRGWRELTSVTPLAMMSALENFCAAFLYTHIETEGLMQGIPMEVVSPLRAATRKQLIVAGGISSPEEVAELEALKVDAVVGMAIYTGKFKLR